VTAPLNHPHRALGRSPVLPDGPRKIARAHIGIPLVRPPRNLWPRPGWNVAPRATPGSAISVTFLR
jgi:hypothetical protein